MATVTIKSIGRQYLLTNEEYIWLLEHRDEPLPLSSVTWHRDGKLDYFVVRIGKAHIVVVYPDYNKVKYEVNYNA